MGPQKTRQGDLLAPEPACAFCPRLVEFRKENTANHPQWHNRPVPSFGTLDARLLIVGLAPGLKGANRTGRPFTGDYAGDLLYRTLPDFDLAKGTYGGGRGRRLYPGRLPDHQRGALRTPPKQANCG